MEKLYTVSKTRPGADCAQIMPKLGAVESQNTVSYPMPSAGLHRLYITSLPVLSWGAGGGV